MRRRLLNTFLGISLLLCVATAVLWLRSYYSKDKLSWASPYSTTSAGTAANGVYLVSNGGAIVFGQESGTWAKSFPYWGETYDGPRGFSLRSEPHPRYSIGPGFWGNNYVDAQRASRWNPAYVNHERFIRIPWWAIFVTALLTSTPFLVPEVRRRRRRLRGLCVRCGYDLRATPGGCPECGTVPKSKPVRDKIGAISN
jgi:hypothetical protein